MIASLPVRRIMDQLSAGAATISAEATLSDATRTMMARNVRLLLVVAADQSVAGTPMIGPQGLSAGDARATLEG